MRKYWDWFNSLAIFTVLLWVGETIFFLIRDGWHVKAVAPEEIVADTIVSVLFNVCGILFFVVLYNFLDRILVEENEDENLLK